MFSNYFKIAFRNLRKHQLFNGINIFGLALAICISVLLFSTALLEFSYDQFHENIKDIHLLYFKKNRPNGVELSRVLSAPIIPSLKADFPELIGASRWGNGRIDFKYGDHKHRFSTKFADKDFFKMFSFRVLKGNIENPLDALNSLVISDQVANIVFEEEDPIGKTLSVSLDGQLKDLVVTAVVESTPHQSSLQFNMVTRFENDPFYKDMVDNWDNSYHEGFIQLPKNSEKADFERKFLAFTEKHFGDDIEMMENSGSQRDENGAILSLLLQPFKSLHFAPELGMHSSINKIYPTSLMVIGFFVLIIACINFVNLTISTSIKRALEVGLRKVLGANRSQLMGQFWGESTVIVFIALLLALMLIQWSLPYYNGFFENDISIANPFIISSLAVVLVLISIGGGIYPAILLAKFQPANVLKGNTKLQKPGLLRNLLVVIQFAIAVLLISNTLIIRQQLDFIQQKSLGYNKDQVVSIPLNSNKDNRKIVNLFRSELSNYKEVLAVSGTFRNFGQGRDNGGGSSIMTLANKEGKEIRTHWHGIDYDFFKTMDIELVAGKDFQKGSVSDSILPVVINQTLAKQLGSDDVVGTFMDRGNNYKIIGIAKDYHFEPLSKPIEAATLMIDDNFNPNYLLVKVVPTDFVHSLAILERTFKNIFPNRTFNGSLLDENAHRQYQKETKLSKLFIGVSIFAIFLSCLGLLGIAIITIVQRTKEVGIRKVLGASIPNLVALLSKDFLKLVLIGTLIGLPLSWYGMSNWLQDYYYRTDLHWSIFATAGLIAVVVAFSTIAIQTFKAAMANPVEAIKIE